MDQRLTGACLLVLALASCGGGGDSGPPGGDRFTERANGVCERLAEDVDRASRQTFGGSTEPLPGAARRAYERRVDSLSRAALAELRAIPPPPAQRRRVTAAFDSLERGLDQLTSVPATRPGAPDAGPAIERFDRQATDLGLDACTAER